MMKAQLDLFSAPVVSESRRGPRAGTTRTSGPKADDLARCPHHGHEFICPSCATCGDTNGLGFLHRAVCGGRTPLRACAACGSLRSLAEWNHADWNRCLDCAPHPVLTPMVVAARKKDRRQA